MPLDPSIPLQTSVANPANMIGNFLDLGLKRNALEVSNATLPAQIAEKQAQASTAQSVAGQTGIGLKERQGVAGVLSRIKDYTDPQGNVDYNRLLPDVMSVAPTTGAEIMAHVFTAQQASTLAKQAVNSLDDQTRQIVGKTLFGLQGQPPEAIQRVVGGLVQQYPNMEPAVNFFGKYMFGNAKTQPEIDAALVKAGQLVQPPPTQQDMGTPTTVAVAGAQGTQQFNVKPGVPNAPQFQPIGTMQGPPMGTEAGIAGPIAVASKHFETVVSDAQAAPTRIAALQTIMQTAPEATTSGGDWRRKFWQMLGSVYQTDTAAANDVIAKNVALIASQGGNTDLAKTLGEMSTPGGHMTLKGIQETGQQLVGIELKKQAAQQFFTGIPTNDPKYSERMNVWSKNADPRLWEYASLPPEEKASWMKRLSPGVRSTLGMKAKALEQQGVQFGQ